VKLLPSSGEAVEEARHCTEAGRDAIPVLENVDSASVPKIQISTISTAFAHRYYLLFLIAN